MLKRRALMESISSNLHCFLKRIGHNLSVPDKKFLRDGLTGQLRCGQVILSQANGAIWLGTDSVEGCLMTQLKSGCSSAPLSSQTYITDGAWYHISFTWNASQRHLYADGLEVTNDTTACPGQRRGWSVFRRRQRSGPRHVLLWPDRRHPHLQSGHKSIERFLFKMKR